MRTNVHITAVWGSPPQDIARRVLIPIKYASTCAPMNASRKRLTNYLAAVAALLAGVLCVDQFHSTAGAFSLARQDADELAPASIGDTASQPAIPQHACHVEAFRSNDRVPIDQRTRDFVVHVPPDITNLRVQSRDTLFNKLSTVAAAFTSTQRTLTSAQLWQRSFERSTVAKLLAIGSGDERFKADVDTDTSRVLGRLGNRHVDQEDDKPLASVAKYGGLFNPAVLRQASMPTDADGANVLEAKFSVNNGAASSVMRHIKGKRLESIQTFKTRTAEPKTEKSSIGFVDCPKRLLRGVTVELSKMTVGAALSREPSTLFVVRPVDPCRIPTKHFAVERLIVESAVSFECYSQFATLACIGEQSVLVSANHLFRIPLKKFIDCTPNQFRILHAATCREPLQYCKLLVREIKGSSRHACNIRLMYARVKERG